MITTLRNEIFRDSRKYLLHKLTPTDRLRSCPFSCSLTHPAHGAVQNEAFVTAVGGLCSHGSAGDGDVSIDRGSQGGASGHILVSYRRARLITDYIKAFFFFAWRINLIKINNSILRKKKMKASLKFAPFGPANVFVTYVDIWVELLTTHHPRCRCGQSLVQ